MLEYKDRSDTILIQQSLAGDQEAFEAILSRYSARLRGFIIQYLKDEELTADTLQHVFLQLYIALPKLAQEKSVRNWLFLVAKYRCIDELRKRKRHPTVHFSELEGLLEDEDLSFLDRIADPLPLTEELLERYELQRTLLQAIRKLSSRTQTIVLMRYGCMSFVEIGRKLHMPAGTAKTYFQRARPRLRALLTT